MNIFFGAGKLGKRHCIFWKECGIVVDYFMDNNPTLWYKWIEGVEVIPPEKLKDFTEDITILITCSKWKPIWIQLQELGVQTCRIKRCNTEIAMLTALKENPSFCWPLEMPDNIELTPHDVLFGLDSSGSAIGGVETWILNTVEELGKLGWNACVLLNHDTRIAMSKRKDMHRVKTIDSDGLTRREELLCTIGLMLQYRNIICNFTKDYMMAAILIKERFPMQYRVIAVIHSDAEGLYQNYMDAEPYLDKCLIISSKIGDEMIKRGFPKEKLMYLPWKIPCNEVFTHFYSKRNEPLHIGYAGRIVINIKRVDLLLTVAKKLEERDIDFRIEIAGTGLYEEELRRQIQVSRLESKVFCLGMLADISLFWSKQDIMITCSEREGHSVSQCEAMAAGAVPIITDTSGARDDVEDGINGFIVNIGDIDQMVERISFLYLHREQLPILGERAHKTVLEKNKAYNFQKLWEDILLK